MRLWLIFFGKTANPKFDLLLRFFTVKKEKNRVLSPFAFLSIVIFIPTVTVYLLCCSSVIIADFFNSTLCHEFRKIMASFGDLFPFSLIEFIVIALPLILAGVIYLASRAFSRGRGLRFIINLFAVVLLIYSGHLIALGIGYKTTPISQRMELTDTEVNEDSLARVMTLLRDEINELSPLVPRDDAGVFTSGYDFDGISEKLCEAYAKFYEQYGFPKSFNSRVKGVYHGNLMSYLEITGIYTYVTGEANVNTAFPDYDTIFTSAHEMSHQRGILRENEANFAAYVVCSLSDDVNLRYSAALTMYEYVSSALYRTDPDRYKEIAANLSEGAVTDMRASYAVVEKYSDTFIGRLSNRVNDIFLKSNGTEGVVTYSRVVELVVAYLAQ